MCEYHFRSSKPNFVTGIKFNLMKMNFSVTPRQIIKQDDDKFHMVCKNQAETNEYNFTVGEEFDSTAMGQKVKVTSAEIK